MAQEDAKLAEKLCEDIVNLLINERVESVIFDMDAEDFDVWALDDNYWGVSKDYRQ